MESNSVLSAIDSGRWQRAAFTSYTLSLTYYESHVAPRLRKSGCQSVAILVDTAGYLDSLMEQRARGVGRDYSVSPVSVKSGIFHPKLVHLWAEDGYEDLLLVGSGNLTYPGHGGNVEVLEILRPSLHAAAFLQAAKFFEHLMTKAGIEASDPATLEQQAARLRLVAGFGQDLEDVAFVHSIEESGLNQFLRAAKAFGRPWRELLVLSPYHHKSAAPTKQVLQELGIKRLTVGVSPKSETTSFPFSVASTWGLAALSVCAPVAENGRQRGLHAKWFELRRPDAALILTGSFNATKKSFNSTENVECGVLRPVDAPSNERWKEAESPPFKADEFPQRFATATLCLVATIEASGSIKGAILTASNREVGGTWSCRLETSEEILDTAPIEVDTQGQFTWELSKTFDVVDSLTLQLTLQRGDEVARGWVEVAQLLNMDPSHRAIAQALRQVASGSFERNDYESVLDFARIEAAKLLTKAMPPDASKPDGRASSKKAASDSPSRSLSADEFAALGSDLEIPERYDGGLMLGALSGGASGWDALKQLCAALLTLPKKPKKKHPPNKKPDSNLGDDDDASMPPDEDDQNSREQERKEAELNRVIGAFTKVIEDARIAFRKATSDEERNAIELGRARVLQVALAVELRFRLIELNDPDAVQNFLWRWFKQVCDLQLSAELKQPLTEQVLGVAAVSSLLLIEKPAGPSNQLDELRQVHRFLYRYFAGVVDAQAAEDGARNWLQTKFGVPLTQGRTDSALVALSEVLREPPEHQVLAAVLKDGLDAHVTLARETFNSLTFASLRQMLAPSPKPRYTTVNYRHLNRCPACGHTLEERHAGYGSGTLDSEVAWRLRQIGFFMCNCSHFLVAQEAS